MRRVLALAFFCPCLVSALPAQGRVFVVDGNNGPGTNFTDLPPAIAAASDGDTIRIRPFSASYTGTTTGKALRLLRDGQGTASIGFLGRQGLVVTGLPAGSRFVIDGLTCGGGFSFRSNRGTVHLESITVDPGWLSPTTCMVEVYDCELVTFQTCRMTICTLFHTSTVSLSGCTLSGGNYMVTQTVWAALTPLIVSGSSLYVSDSQIRGVDAYYYGGPGPTLQQPATPGIRTSGSRLFLTGATTVQGGQPATYFPGEPGIAGSSAMFIDPQVRVIGGRGTPPIVGGPVTRRPIPSLTAAASGPGGTVTATLGVPAGAAAAVVASLPAPVVRFPIGDFALDPTSTRVVGSTPSSTTGALSLSFGVPSIPVLDGAPIALQGIAIWSTGVALSTPTTVILH